MATIAGEITPTRKWRNRKNDTSPAKFATVSDTFGEEKSWKYEIFRTSKLFIMTFQRRYTRTANTGKNYFKLL